MSLSIKSTGVDLDRMIENIGYIIDKSDIMILDSGILSDSPMFWGGEWKVNNTIKCLFCNLENEIEQHFIEYVKYMEYVSSLDKICTTTEVIKEASSYVKMIEEEIQKCKDYASMVKNAKYPTNKRKISIYDKARIILGNHKKLVSKVINNIQVLDGFRENEDYKFLFDFVKVQRKLINGINEPSKMDTDEHIIASAIYASNKTKKEVCIFTKDKDFGTILTNIYYKLPFDFRVVAKRMVNHLQKDKTFPIVEYRATRLDKVV